MNQLTTVAIVLTRTNYGEADRIITVLTPDYGKLRLMAKGVRRVKSKLAGGIELFSVSNITFIRGRGDIGTLVSTRLLRHYGRIVGDIARVQQGYDLIKMLNKAIEDNAEAAYFELMEQAFQALDDDSLDVELIRLWFVAQIVRLGGHTPNLHTDTAGAKLSEDQTYEFDIDAMAFAPREQGRYTPGHIKFLRLVFSGNQPKILGHIQGKAELVTALQPLVQTIFAMQD